MYIRKKGVLKWETPYFFSFPSFLDIQERELFLLELLTFIMLIEWKYKKEQFASSVRKIDFERGKPWVWRLEDYNELMSSDCMFARKFSSNVDKNIIDKIYKTIRGENEDSILPTK